MDRGGVETWLMHVMRNIDRQQFEFHFLVETEAECAFDREIVSLGGKIHCGGDPRNFVRYAKRFKEVVTKHGPFDALHSHVFWSSGFLVKLAHECGIPIRIAHSHNAAKESPWRVQRILYRALMRRWITKYATHNVAASAYAGDALFGSPYYLICCGLDFSGFSSDQPLQTVKRQLGIDPSRKVITHIGRFVPQKNHRFLIGVFDELIKNQANVHLILVGTGPLQPEIQALVNSKGLGNRCTFAGAQSDVIPFLKAADVTLFPSRWEGLGLVTLESQAAGVPVIASTNVTKEIDVIPRLVEHLPLSDGPTVWAQAIRSKLKNPPAKRGNESEVLQSSRFGISACLDSLSKLYTGGSMEIRLAV
jgi:glycosyltransferase involved in cell wall biosynthesis